MQYFHPISLHRKVHFVMNELLIIDNLYIDKKPLNERDNGNCIALPYLSISEKSVPVVTTKYIHKCSTNVQVCPTLNLISKSANFILVLRTTYIE